MFYTSFVKSSEFHDNLEGCHYRNVEIIWCFKQTDLIIHFISSCIVLSILIIQYLIKSYLMKYDLECWFNIYLVLYYSLFFFSKNNIIKYLYYHHKSSTSVISYSYILKDKFTEPLIFLNMHEKYDKFILTYSSPTK